MSFTYPDQPTSDKGSGEMPFIQRMEVTAASVTIAADATTTVGECQIATADGLGVAGTPTPILPKVTKCAYIPGAAMTGDNTNARTFTLVNKGAAGVGTTVIGTLAMTTGVNGVAFDESLFTLSVVALATSVTLGDVLAFVSTHTGTGIVDPGGRVIVEITRAP